MFTNPKQLTDNDIWSLLPLSEQQRKNIYNDIVLTGKYDKKELCEMKEKEKNIKQNSEQSEIKK